MFQNGFTAIHRGHALLRQVPHLAGINSAGYCYSIQSELSYLEEEELHFNNKSFPWINYYQRSHS